MMELQFKRPDGTFVATVNGLPYHVTKDDPLYKEAARTAKTMKDALAFEPQPVAPEPTEADYSAAIQSMLDEKARERSYDGIASAISYRGDSNPVFAAEAEALFAWRSSVWTYAQTELAAVKAGTHQQPAVADFLAKIREEIPFSWPRGAP